MLASVPLISKFASEVNARVCELRNRDTSDRTAPGQTMDNKARFILAATMSSMMVAMPCPSAIVALTALLSCTLKVRFASTVVLPMTKTLIVLLVSSGENVS